MSARTITLFTDRRDPGPGAASVLVSLGLHSLAAGAVAYAVLSAPRVVDHRYDRMAVRHVDLRAQNRTGGASAAQQAAYPGPRLQAGAGKTGNEAAAPQAMRRRVAGAEPGPQTLVQPELQYHIALREPTPVPAMILWTPHKIVVNNIVAPLPDKPTAAEMAPANEAPNEEVNLGDQGISAAQLASRRQPIHATTTSPIEVHRPENIQLAPQTVSQTREAPTPAAVMSLSDVRMAEGTATLPPANESAQKNKEGTLGGAAGGAAMAPKRGGAADGSAVAPKDHGAAGGAAPAAEPGSAGAEAHATLIELPENGAFGSVIVGASIEDQFPEVSGVWRGRLAYTVYLHVGLAKNWLMQYSLPAEAVAEAGGSIGRLRAPWPYSILRPNLAPGSIAADALLIHGYLNEMGRFESMKVAYPLEFAQAGFVLRTLDRWQFRPATQGGQATRVEVLLIIPALAD